MTEKIFTCKKAVNKAAGGVFGSPASIVLNYSQ